MQCQELNPGQIHVREAPYLLYYLSDSKMYPFILGFEPCQELNPGSHPLKANAVALNYIPGPLSLMSHTNSQLPA